MFAVGWGANQFAAMLLVYRDRIGVSAGTADALFGLYALGLVPALLVGGPLSDRFGRRGLARPAVVLSLVATVVLVVGAHSVVWLGVARLLAGVASGLVFAPGTAWVKELSAPPWDPDADAQAGARRPAIWLTAGFGTGPLVAGLLAAVPARPARPPVRAAPGRRGRGRRRGLDGTGDRHPRPGHAGAGPGCGCGRRPAPRFRGVVAPLAPWVFGAASISLTLGAAFVARPDRRVRRRVRRHPRRPHPRHGRAGPAARPPPRRARQRARRDRRTAPRWSLGCLVQALTAHTANPVLAVAGRPAARGGLRQLSGRGAARDPAHRAGRRARGPHRRLLRADVRRVRRPAAADRPDVRRRLRRPAARDRGPGGGDPR